MKNIRIILAIFAALLIMAAGMCAFAETTTVASGSCGADGDNVTWTLDSDGVLTISGSGAMDDFATNSYRWGGKYTSIKSVVIEEGITYIGGYTFYKCSGLKSLSLPSTLESVGYNAIYSSWCTSLTSIHISDMESWLNLSMDSSNTIMGHGKTLYLNSVPVSEVVIPYNIKAIRADAFHGCTTLKSITIPAGVESIGNSAFNRCSGLTEVTLPDSLTSIDGWAFYQCTGIKKVSIPDSVTAIDVNAFNGCTALADIYFYGSDLPEIGGSAFSGCTPTVHCSKGSAVETWANENKYEVAYLPIAEGTCGDNLTWTLDADGVLTISGSGKMTDYSYSTDDAWNGNYEKIESVVISEGVTTVGDYAFNGCKALTSVSLPESLTSIESHAFDNCSALTSISIPDGVTEIKSGTFYMCDVLSNVKLPSNLTSIGMSSFIFTSIEEIDIPDTLTTIRDTAFYGSKLKSFTIPDSVTSIGSKIFHSCTSLTDVYFLGSDLPTINDEAFFGCNPIIHCEKGSAIDTWAAGKEIRRVYDLVEPTASLVIPAYTRTIGDESFMGTNIQKVVLSDKCTTIGSKAFANCADLVVIYMPDSVTSIATSAFDGCYGFKFVCESNNYAVEFAETHDIYWEIE